MVPFSFKSDSVKVACDAKIYIVILGGAWNWESGAFALSCLLAFLIVIPAWAKICENPNEFAKIQVNPTKSDQIKPLFLWESRDERGLIDTSR